MRSTWAKAVLLLASSGAVDADPGKYDVVKMAQPADRVVEF
jgi:hypothetical protein